MDEPLALLAKLSKDLCDRGCYLQAAKCLEAASGISTALPHEHALFLLDYATLLIDHFDNLDRAKTVLLQAVSCRWRPQAHTLCPPCLSTLKAVDDAMCRKENCGLSEVTMACGARSFIFLQNAIECRMTKTKRSWLAKMG